MNKSSLIYNSCLFQEIAMGGKIILTNVIKLVAALTRVVTSILLRKVPLCELRFTCERRRSVLNLNGNYARYPEMPYEFLFCLSHASSLVVQKLQQIYV